MADHIQTKIQNNPDTLDLDMGLLKVFIILQTFFRILIFFCGMIKKDRMYKNTHLSSKWYGIWYEFLIHRSVNPTSSGKITNVRSRKTIMTISYESNLVQWQKIGSTILYLFGVTNTLLPCSLQNCFFRQEAKHTKQ